MSTSSSDPIVDVFQISFYVGINIENILYGMELLLYFKMIQIILCNKRMRRKSDMFYALFSTMMALLITIWVATQGVFGEKMWLLYPNFPGGPDAYWQTHIAVWYMDLGTTAIIVLQLMTDALMIHRCRIVWNSYRAIVVPIVLWLATLAMGFLMDWTSSAPGSDFFTGFASRVGLAYYILAVLLNTMLTCMICYRMIRHGKWAEKHLGREYASLYFTVTTMIVESMLPYTISGVAFLVSYGMGSPTSIAFVSVYLLMMCISPQMLILRVILGRAWVNDTFNRQNPSIQFDFRNTFASPRFDSSGARTHLQTLTNVYLPDGQDKV